MLDVKELDNLCARFSVCSRKGLDSQRKCDKMSQLAKFMEWCKRGGLSTAKTGIKSFKDTRTQNAWNGWIAAMNQKVTDYTVIYEESFMRGSHRHSYTKIARISLLEGETLDKCLEREDLKAFAVYVFEGHPKLVGDK